jgi:hypothetical protein
VLEYLSRGCVSTVLHFRRFGDGGGKRKEDADDVDFGHYRVTVEDS